MCQTEKDKKLKDSEGETKEKRVSPDEILIAKPVERKIKLYDPAEYDPRD